MKVPKLMGVPFWGYSWHYSRRVGSSFNILGFVQKFSQRNKHYQRWTNKKFKQTLSSYNGVGWWKLLFYFQGEKTSWGGFWSGIPDMQVKISLMHPAKRLGDAHAKAQEYSIHSWPMCFGGRGFSDDGKMANHHFGTVSLVLYLVCCCLNIYLFVKLLWKCHWKV